MNEHTLTEGQIMYSPRTLETIVAVSRAMHNMLAIAREVASGPQTVFIDGEEGTGRKLVARVIHEEGPNGFRPLVTVRCDALTVDCMDRILFGDRRSGDTGKFDEAAGSTLLLTNLERLNPVAQERLLSLLEKGRYVSRTDELRPITFRVISTGNYKEIEQSLRLGRFSGELFEKLSATALYVPSLSERREDIPHLVVEILHGLAKRERIEPPAVPYHYMELLMNVAWPENVRQLRNHVESVMVLSEGNFDPAIIEEHFVTEGSAGTIKNAVQSLWSKLRGASLNPAMKGVR